MRARVAILGPRTLTSLAPPLATANPDGREPRRSDLARIAQAVSQIDA